MEKRNFQKIEMEGNVDEITLTGAGTVLNLIFHKTEIETKDLRDKKFKVTIEEVIETHE